MKFWLFSILVSMFAIGMPAVATATEADLPVTVIRKTGCDVRAPRVALEIKVGAQRVGYGYPDSDTIFWLDARGVQQGTRKYTLAKQPFGSSREWVMVVAYKGDQGLTTAPTLTFARPTKAECIVTQVHQLGIYRAGVNTVCPEASLTMYLVTVAVKPGSPGYIVDAGTATLVQKNDKQLQSGGGYVYDGSSRKAEFYVYAGRFSQLQLDPSLNRAGLKTSSDKVELTSSVYRTCQGEVA